MVGGNEYAKSEDIALSVSIDDNRRSLKLCRLCLYRCNSRHTSRGVDGSRSVSPETSIRLIPQSHWIKFLPQGTSVICWQSW